MDRNAVNSLSPARVHREQKKKSKDGEADEGMEPPKMGEPEDTGKDDEEIDFAKKKKKKKPKDEGESEDGKPVVADDNDDSEVLEFKTKKKLKDDVAEEEEKVLADDDDDDEVLDFSASKKKKKKPKTVAAADEDGGSEGTMAAAVDDDDDEEEDGDDCDDGGYEGGDGDGGFISIPADREYKYEELLDRMYSLLHANNPELAGDRKRFLIKPPQVVREGSKRVVLTNFGEICKTLNRSMDHVYSFMLAEMGTTGSIDASSRMVIKGRFPPKAIEQIIRRYVGEYVSCSSCKSPATTLQKQNRLYFMQCNNCGARRSVTPIKTGFVAISRGARKKNRV